jgi:hypothetical protein
MELKVIRRWKKETYTIGEFYVDGQRFSDTCEDRDRGLSQDMPLDEIKRRKIYGKTAIPTGTYEIQMTYSPKFASRQFAKKYHGKVLQIMDVKGYYGVRIHPFNTAEESYGCIAVGRNLEKGKVLQSTAHYLRLLEEHVLPAMRRGERITLTII